MEITLSPASEEFIRKKLAAGNFRSAEEIITEGLQLLEKRDQGTDARAKIEEAREQLRAGMGLSPQELERNLSSRKALWKSENNQP